MNKEVLTYQTIREEWRQFQMVANKGGRADCQDRPETFYNMRKAQLDTWPEELIKSYLDDLVTAWKKGDNLVTRKYAYMMKYTDPTEYEKIRRFLPEITANQQQLISEILDIQTGWTEEFNQLYPKLAARSRPTKEDAGEIGITSFRTYLEGELATYSISTLFLYYRFIMNCVAEGINLTYKVRENIVHNAGYRSVEETEEALDL